MLVCVLLFIDRQDKRGACQDDVIMAPRSEWSDEWLPALNRAVPRCCARQAAFANRQAPLACFRHRLSAQLHGCLPINCNARAAHTHGNTDTCQGTLAPPQPIAGLR